MTVSLTQASYPSNYGFSKTTEFCYIFKKLMKSCQEYRRFSLEEHFPNICANVLSIKDSIIECPLNFKIINITDSIRRFVVDYAKENIAKVNIFLKEPFVKRYNREEKITQNAFIGTIGGLLGLFLGFSFISIAEIIYLICSSCFGLFYRKSQNTSKKPPDPQETLFLKSKDRMVAEIDQMKQSGRAQGQGKLIFRGFSRENSSKIVEFRVENKYFEDS